MNKPSLAAAQIYYDLRGAPITFDGAKYFAVAVAHLRKAGFKAFHVHVVANDFREMSLRDRAYSDGTKIWRLNNIILRLPRLIPDVENVTLATGDFGYIGSPRYPKEYAIAPVGFDVRNTILAQATARGEDIHVYEAGGFAKDWARAQLKGEKTIVFTLRTADFDEVRNTPLDLYMELYTHLKTAGYRVLVIPDQSDVLFGKQFARYDWEAIPEAALDLELRLALYQTAFANISWAGGNCMLLWCSRSRFLQFGDYNTKSPVSDDEYYRRIEIKVGDRPNHFLESQELDWREASQLTASYLIETTDRYLRTLAGS